MSEFGVSKFDESYNDAEQQHPFELDSSEVRRAEDELASQLKATGGIDLDFLITTANVCEQEKSVFIEDSLARALELSGFHLMRSHLAEELQNLNLSNSPNDNLILHKIIDFVEKYGTTVQDHVEDEIDQEGIDYYEGFFLQFHDFAERELSHSKNYLVQAHFRDICDMLHMYDSPKPDALEGVPGGGRDGTIYTFSHIDEAYQNRLALGINEGYPIANPVFQIAPGYYGYFVNETLSRVYRQEDYLVEPVSALEHKLISQNNPDDDYIYDQIAEPVFMPNGQRTTKSNGLQKLQDIWDFNDHLRDEGRDFFYDISRIDNNELHPLVYADFLSRNSELLQRKNGAQNRARPLSGAEFRALLFPHREGSDAENYSYLNLTKLHMRKKIETDFGVDPSNHDFTTQRNFLNFLERQDVDSVSALQRLTLGFGDSALKVFLSLEEDADFGNKIIEISERIDHETAQRIFSKYAEIIAATERVADYVAESAPDGEETNPDFSQKIKRQLLQRGKDLLLYFAEHTSDNTAELLSQLESVKQNVVLLSAFMKQSRESGLGLDALESLPGVEVPRIRAKDLTAEQKDVILRIMDKNYHPSKRDEPDETIRHELHKEAALAIGEAGKSFEKDNVEFEFLTVDGDIVAFLRYETDADGTVYFGSFNVLSSARGSSLGTAFLHKSLYNKTGPPPECEGKTVRAIADIHLPITEHYINKCNFCVDFVRVEDVQVEVDGRIENQKLISFEIVSDPRVLKNTYTIDQVIADYEAGARVVVRFNVSDSASLGRFLTRYLAIGEKKEKITYFKSDPSNPNIKYAVFEIPFVREPAESTGRLEEEILDAIAA